MVSQHNQAGLFIHSLRKDCDICTEFETIHAKLATLLAGARDPVEGGDDNGGGEPSGAPPELIPRASSLSRGDWQVDTAFMAEEGFLLVNTPVNHGDRGIDFLQFSLGEASYGLLKKSDEDDLPSDKTVGGIDIRGRRPRISGGRLQMVDGVGEVLDEHQAPVANPTASGWAGSCTALGSNKWLLRGFDSAIFPIDTGLIWSVDEDEVVMTSGVALGPCYAAFSALEGPYVILFGMESNDHKLLTRTYGEYKNRPGGPGSVYLLNVETGRVSSLLNGHEVFPQPLGLVTRTSTDLGVGILPWALVEATLENGGDLRTEGLLSDEAERNRFAVLTALAEGTTSPIGQMRYSHAFVQSGQKKLVSNFSAPMLQVDSSGMVAIGRVAAFPGTVVIGDRGVFSATSSAVVPNTSDLPNTSGVGLTAVYNSGDFHNLRLWNGDNATMSEVWSFRSPSDPNTFVDARDGASRPIERGIPRLAQGTRLDGSQLFAFDVTSDGAIVIVENGRPALGHYVVSSQPSGAVAVIPRDEFVNSSPLDPRIQHLGTAATLVGQDRCRQMS